VLRASSAEEAENAIREELPDVLILDWMLPGESGVTLTRRLRAEERTRELPILMLTARAMEHDKVSGSTPARTTISPSRSRRRSSPRASRRCCAGARRSSPTTWSEMAGLRLDPAGRRVTANGAVVELAPTEFRLLHFLMTTPSASTRARRFSITSGATTCSSRSARSTFTSGACARRSRPTLHDRLIDTVRGSGYGFRKP